MSRINARNSPETRHDQSVAWDASLSRQIYFANSILVKAENRGRSWPERYEQRGLSMWTVSDVGNFTVLLRINTKVTRYKCVVRVLSTSDSRRVFSFSGNVTPQQGRYFTDFSSPMEIEFKVSSITSLPDNLLPLRPFLSLFLCSRHRLCSMLPFSVRYHFDG